MAAELDAVQARLLIQYPLPLRWDNAEGGPEWLAGPKPACPLYKVGLHQVCLRPGQAASIQVPPSGLLRLFRPTGKLTPEDVEVWISDGSELYVRYCTRPSEDGRSLIVVTDNPYSSVVRIKRPQNQACAIDLAVFTSRWEPLGEIAPYRELVPLGIGGGGNAQNIESCADRLRVGLARRFHGPIVEIRRSDEATGDKYWCIAPGVPGHADVCGPARLAVETRLRYPQSEARAFQDYHIRASFECGLERILEYKTQPESRHPVFVSAAGCGCSADGRPVCALCNKCPELVGRNEVAYLEVPAGDHHIVFDTSAELYVRLLRQQSPDYLLPRLNQPPLSAACVRGMLLSGVLQCSPWRLPQNVLQQYAAAAPPCFVAEKERVALELIRCNSHRDGAMLGTMLMRSAGIARPDYPLVRDVAEKLQGMHTFYRDVLPSEKNTLDPQNYAWFIQRRLLEAGECITDVVVAQQQIDALLDQHGLYDGLFVSLPECGTPHVYQIPSRPGPSLLRIAVRRQSLPIPADLLLQFDDNAPVRLQLAPNLIACCTGGGAEASCAGPAGGSVNPAVAVPVGGIPRFRFRTSTAEAALAALRWQSCEADGGTLGGPFSRTRTPAPLLELETAELFLGAHVQQVRISMAGPSPSTLQVAVQYRASKPYVLSEMAYLEALQRVGGDCAAAALLAGMLKNQDIAACDMPAANELKNQWVALLRLLRSQSRQFSAAVSPLSKHDPSVKSGGDGPGNPGLLAEAREMQRQGQWLTALELWTRIMRESQGDIAQEAIWGRIRALQEMGEDYLARQQLRSLYLYDADASMRRQARDRLQRIYVREDDRESLLALFSVDALRDPTPENLRSLAEALLANQEYEMALMVSLAVAEECRPLAAMLRAAYLMQWWQVYDCLSSRLATPEEKNFWQAYRVLSLGAYRQAIDLFSGAGEPGQILAARLSKGLDIQCRLAAAGPDTLQNVLRDWAAWQAEFPGLAAWNEDLSLALDYAGAETLYSIDRDIYSRLFRAAPKRPLVLEVHGPTRLQIEARPLHPKDSTEPLDDWLQIRGVDFQRVVPITDNRPSQGLALPGNGTLVPGTKVLEEIELGPGAHRLQISCETGQALFAARVLRPEMPLGVVPPLTRYTVAAVARGEYAAAAPDIRTPSKACILAAGASCAPVVVPLVQQSPMGGSSCMYETSTEEQDCITCRITPESLSAIKIQEAEHLVDEGLGRGLKITAGQDYEEEALRRMYLLTWLAEKKPSRKLHAQILGDSIFKAHPMAPGIQTAHARLMRGSTWNPLPGVWQSAGVRLEEAEGWEPESPGLKARAALLGPLQSADMLVCGEQQYVVMLSNVRPAKLKLELAAEDVEGLLPMPLTAVYQLGRERREVTVAAGKPQTHGPIDVPSGQQVFRIWIKQPLANQFLRVRLQLNDKEYLLRKQDRTYQIATRDEPLRHRFIGPGWYRVDELRGQDTLSRFVLKGDDAQQIVLEPQAGRHESLFRLFRLGSLPEKEVIKSRWAKVQPQPVPGPLVQLDCRAGPAEAFGHVGISDERPAPGQPAANGPKLQAEEIPLPDPLPPADPNLQAEKILRPKPLPPTDPESGAERPSVESLAPFFFDDPWPGYDDTFVPAGLKPAVIRDAFRLGTQEDGLWSFDAGYRSRRDLEEDETVHAPDQFAEFGLTHRYFDQWHDTYYRDELLLRTRGNSGPTFAWLENFHCRTYSVPLLWRFDSAVYVQHPYGAIPPHESKTEWSLLLRGAVSQYREITPKLAGG